FILLTPPAEYLPEGEEAKSFSTMIAPPGYSLQEIDRITRELQAEMRPAMQADPADFDNGISEIPALSRITFSGRPESLRVSGVTKDTKRVVAFMEIIDETFRSYPGMRAFSARGSIISSSDGGTRAVALDISGRDLPEIYLTAAIVFEKAVQAIQ